MADGQGGVIVSGTDLRVLGPPSELDRTPAPPRDPVELALTEAIRAETWRQILETIEDALDPQAAEERRQAAVDALLEGQLKPIEEGFAQLRAELEELKAKSEAVKEEQLRKRAAEDRRASELPRSAGRHGPRSSVAARDARAGPGDTETVEGAGTASKKDARGPTTSVASGSVPAATSAVGETSDVRPRPREAGIPEAYPVTSGKPSLAARRKAPDG